MVAIDREAKTRSMQVGAVQEEKHVGTDISEMHSTPQRDGQPCLVITSNGMLKSPMIKAGMPTILMRRAICSRICLFLADIRSDTWR